MRALPGSGWLEIVTIHTPAVSKSRSMKGIGIKINENQSVVGHQTSPPPNADVEGIVPIAV